MFQTYLFREKKPSRIGWPIEKIRKKNKRSFTLTRGKGCCCILTHTHTHTYTRVTTARSGSHAVMDLRIVSMFNFFVMLIGEGAYERQTETERLPVASRSSKVRARPCAYAALNSTNTYRIKNARIKKRKDNARNEKDVLIGGAKIGKHVPGVLVSCDKTL